MTARRPICSGRMMTQSMSGGCAAAPLIRRIGLSSPSSSDQEAGAVDQAVSQSRNSAPDRTSPFPHAIPRQDHRADQSSGLLTRMIHDGS